MGSSAKYGLLAGLGKGLVDSGNMLLSDHLESLRQERLAEIRSVERGEDRDHQVKLATQSQGHAEKLATASTDAQWNMLNTKLSEESSQFKETTALGREKLRAEVDNSAADRDSKEKIARWENDTKSLLASLKGSGKGTGKGGDNFDDKQQAALENNVLTEVLGGYLDKLPPEQQEKERARLLADSVGVEGAIDPQVVLRKLPEAERKAFKEQLRHAEQFAYREKQPVSTAAQIGAAVSGKPQEKQPSIFAQTDPKNENELGKLVNWMNNKPPDERQGVIDELKKFPELLAAVNKANKKAQQAPPDPPEDKGLLAAAKEKSPNDLPLNAPRGAKVVPRTQAPIVASAISGSKSAPVRPPGLTDQQWQQLLNAITKQTASR